MEQWSAVHRAFVSETFLRNNDQYTQRNQAFRIKFGLQPHYRVPSWNTLNIWVKPGSESKRRNAGEYGARTEAPCCESDTVQCKTRFSLKPIAANLQNNNQGFVIYLYKIKLTQEVKPTDYEKRLVFAHSVRDKLEFGELTRNSLLLCDEAHFHLCKSVNEQNCLYYPGANAHQIHEKPLHSERVTVWCGVAE